MSDLTPGPIPDATQGPAPGRARPPVVFPESIANPGPRGWRRPRGRLIVAVIAALVLVAGGLMITQAAASSTGTYRTAVVGEHDVAQVLTGVATIEAVNQASVAFPVGGTVASVDVGVGDTVAAGQTLAAVGTDDLVDTLHERQASLAEAELTLEQALAGEDVGGRSGASGGSGASDGSSTSTPSATGVSLTTSQASTTQASSAASPASGGSGDTDLRSAQQAVLDAQHQVDAALAVSTQALASSTDVCAAATTSTAAGAEVAACQTALLTVSEAQNAVAAAQSTLAAAVMSLDTLLEQRAASSSSATTESPSTGTSSAGTTTGTVPAASSTSSSPSSADLIAYQKAVDAASAEVAVAEQAIDQATIVSPIAGTVAAVNLAVGDTVDAASSTATIVVVGPGGFEATTLVAVADIPDVAVGQDATLVPDGGASAIVGRVVGISVTPDSSASSTSYRVTIALDDQATDLGNGATGSVSIVTAAVTSALAVPTSAVSAVGDLHTVTVLDGGTTSTVMVRVGVVGDTWTEVADGLTAGQEVVLAALDEPLPGSATDTSSATSGAGARTGFPGAGRFPGGATGFPGGGPTRSGN